MKIFLLRIRRDALLGADGLQDFSYSYYEACRVPCLHRKHFLIRLLDLTWKIVNIGRLRVEYLHWPVGRILEVTFAINEEGQAFASWTLHDTCINVPLIIAEDVITNALPGLDGCKRLLTEIAGKTAMTTWHARQDTSVRPLWPEANLTADRRRAAPLRQMNQLVKYALSGSGNLDAAALAAGSTATTTQRGSAWWRSAPASLWSNSAPGPGT